jgi:hypothetical protein
MAFMPIGKFLYPEAALYPTCQRHLLVNIGDTEFSAGV